MVTYPDIIRSGYTEGGGVGPVAVAAEIKDETAGKMQSAINSEQQTKNQELYDMAVVGWVL